MKISQVTSCQFMRFSYKKYSQWITDNSYILFMVISFLSFYFGISGVLRQILWILLFTLNLKYVRIQSSMDRIVMFYFSASVLTLTGSLVIPYPVTDFIKVFIYSYVPIIFYFVGKYRYSIYTDFIVKSNLGIMFLFILGFYFLLFPTDTYIAKSLEVVNINHHYTEETLSFARFASFMDSYHTANLGICSLCFSFGLLKFSKGLRSKYHKLINISAILFILVSVIAILLARQRVAMYIGLLIFAYYMLSSGFGKIPIFIVVTPVVIGFLYYLFAFSDTLFIEQITRIFSKEGSSTLFSSRVDQWKEAIEGFLMKPIMGLGVGSSGHVAYVSNPQHPIVTDGSYFKILVEGGIVSFLPFMAILCFSLLKSFKYRKIYYMEFPMLLFFSASLLGANIIDMPYIILFMWYIIGRINSKSKYIIYEE